MFGRLDAILDSKVAAYESARAMSQKADALLELKEVLWAVNAYADYQLKQRTLRNDEEARAKRDKEACKCNEVEQTKEA